MGNPKYLYQCPNCHAEVPSHGEAESCPECGTSMRRKTNNRGVREAPDPLRDPRRAFPSAQRQHRPI